MGSVNVIVNLVSSPVDGTVTAGEYAGKGIDSARLHGVAARGRPALQHTCREGQAAGRLSRELNAISEGEFTRVGTCSVENGGEPLVLRYPSPWEIRGRSRRRPRRYRVAPAGSRPVKVALVIDVECVRTKSSADLISDNPPASGRVAVAIIPVGIASAAKNKPQVAPPPPREGRLQSNESRN